MIIEDESSIRNEYKQAVNAYEDIMFVGATDSTTEGLRMVRELNPDAIILDLELHKGYGNGIQFLNDIASVGFVRKPFILVVTNNVSPVTHSIVRNLGADFLITKNQQDYSVNMVLNFLVSILGFGKNITTSADNMAVAKVQGEAEFDKKLKNKISVELDLIGISPKLKGRDYLAEAIELATKKRSAKLSSIIAQKFSKSDASVERAMETAINRTWRTTDIETLEKQYTAYINPNKGVPTVTEFIYYYANKLKENL